MILRRIHTTGMKSKVHPTYKTKYHVANWAAYNQALVRRGDELVKTFGAAKPWRGGFSRRRSGWYSLVRLQRVASSPVASVSVWTRITPD